MKRHFIASIILLVSTSLCYAEKNVKVTGTVFQEDTTGTGSRCRVF